MDKFLAYSCIFIVISKISVQQKWTDADPIPRVITPTKMSGNPVLTLKYFAPIGGFIVPLGHVCTEGVQIALNAIQSSDLLNGYDIQVKMEDTQCFIAEGVRLVMDFLRNLSEEDTIPVMLGPTCESVDYIGGYLKHYNMIAISSGVTSLVAYRNRKRYHSFMLIRGSVESWYRALPAFFSKNNWRNIFVISDAEYVVFEQYEGIMTSRFPEFHLKVEGAVKLKYPIDQLPGEAEIEKALNELSKMNARIVVLHSTFPSLVACKINELGMYGPGYVYIIPEPLAIMPSSFLRFENCTAEMLADVLESVIYHSYGTPSRLYPDTVRDIVGMTGAELDQTLKSRIENPDHSNTWLSFRTACYTTVLTAAVALDKMHKQLLQEGNGNLTKWSTGGKLFSQNGSLFHNKMIKLFDGFRFPNLDSFEHVGVNSFRGVTGFFQPRRNHSFTINNEFDWPGAFYYVPIAWYDDTKSNSTIKRTSAGTAWRTKNGLPPLDSMRVIYQNQPLVHIGIVATFFSLNGMLTIAELWFIVRFSQNSKLRPKAAVHSLYWYFLLCQLIMTLSMFIWPVIGSSYSGTLCMMAVFIAFTGMSGIVVSSLVLQYLCVSNMVIVETTRKKTIRNLKSIKQTALPSQLNLKRKLVKSVQNNTLKLTLYLLLTIIFYNLLLVIIFALWFGLFPVNTVMVPKSYTVSNDDISIAYQTFSFDCSYSKAEYFALPLLIIYAVTAIKSIHLSTSLTKASYEEDIAYMVWPVRITSIMAPFILGGGVVSVFSGTGIMMTSSVVTFLISVLILAANVSAEKNKQQEKNIKIVPSRDAISWDRDRQRLQMLQLYNLID